MRSRIKALTDDEAKLVIEACLHGHGEKGASEDTITRCLSWASGVKAEAALLELVLDGMLSISEIGEDKLVLDELTFVPREAGP